ncbi:MAG: 3-deoxy-manno-octulosonate cytidylyltransferase [Bacteroidota bacterium]
MKKIAVIPARFAATRFPGKLMQRIGDKTIIRMVYENVLKMGLFDDVIVVTDNDNIIEEITSINGTVVKSTKDHPSGSDRIAEAIMNMDVDVVVNVQGDEPFVNKDPLEKLIGVFNDASVEVASVMQKLGPDEDINNPNFVKVVCDKNSNALYFSRSPIPYKRNLQSSLPIYKHVGVYAFRKNTLLSFTKWPMGVLEQTEMLEQLRYLENGVKIKMIETTSTSIGIDTPEDLEKAKLFFASKNK